MDTERYCATLDQLDRTEAIRAVHQALLQLRATQDAASEEGFDNSPAIVALTECMSKAGHMGFAS